MKTPSNDGGAAFPVVDGYHKDGRHRGGESGMTLRDYFAGQALAGYVANENSWTVTCAKSAEDAYNYADAMLAARESKEDSK
jgi:hypothetical protein